MAAPTPSWNTVRTFGTWRNGDGTLKAGAYTVELLTRVTNHTDDDIIPAGPFLNGNLQTLNNASPSLDVMLPASDDPDNDQTAILRITVTFADKSTTEVYVPSIPIADRPIADGGTGLGVDLRKILLGDAVTVASTQYRVGIANGLALLNGAGQVIDATGSPVVGSVTSVAGKTGVIALVKGDVGLGNVDNTSDATKNSAAATLTGKRITERVVAMTDGATITPAGDTTDLGTVTIAGNRTIAAPSGTPTDDQVLALRITQDGTGSRTLTWNAVYSFPGGAPVLKTAAAGVDYFRFRWSSGSSKWIALSVDIASSAEALAGVDPVRSVTPLTLSTVLTAALDSKADLDGSNFVSLAELAPGTLLVSNYDGTNWKYKGATITTRPTSRTDITFLYVDPTGTSTDPSFAIGAVDIVLRSL